MTAPASLPALDGVDLGLARVEADDGDVLAGLPNTLNDTAGRSLIGTIHADDIRVALDNALSGISGQADLTRILLLNQRQVRRSILLEVLL